MHELAMTATDGRRVLSPNEARAYVAGLLHADLIRAGWELLEAYPDEGLATFGLRQVLRGQERGEIVAVQIEISDIAGWVIGRAARCADGTYDHRTPPVEP